MIGYRLLRHHHARRHPAERAGEPELVHGVHAVPAGDLPGPARGAHQLPDHGARADGHGDRQLVDARRVDRRSSRGCCWHAGRLASASNVFLVDADAFPQTLAMLKGRADAVGIELRARRPTPARRRCSTTASASFIQYPGASGQRLGPRPPSIAAVHASAVASAVVAADLLAMTLLKSPGELGADVAVGATQRFGVPMGFGGPHAGYLAVRDGLERQLPGRLVGVSQDAAGHPAYRLSLQAREQHIRREKATSNICTAQVLLAVMASMYAVYHGPARMKRVARAGASERASAFAAAVGAEDARVRHGHGAGARGVPSAVLAAALERGINLRAIDDDTRRRQLRRDQRRRIARIPTSRPSSASRSARVRPRSPKPLQRTARSSTPGVQHAPQRDVDDALPQVPRLTRTTRSTAG